MQLGVPRMHYMSLVDTDGVNSSFLKRGASPRRSAQTIETMIELLPRPKLLAALSDGADGSYIYRFHADAYAKEENEVLMAWRVSGPKDVEIASAHNSVKVTDMLGKSQTFPVKGGKLHIHIGPYPL